ncbi:MAG TPA: TIR domain-containing protein [Steroidobacteraceae bacterium]|nr:TIR domain-containing protein [Steroidobacteraceae bacterium]
MPDIFLSYARDDQPTTRRFAAALERAGFNVWWDQSLNPGESFDTAIEAQLRAAKAVVVLWSKQSVQSRWVRAEASQAARYGSLMPVMIEPCELPIMFELTHAADLSGWRGDEVDPRWRSFVEGLRRLTGAGMGPGAAAAATQEAPRHWVRWIATAAAAVLMISAGVGWQWLQGRGAGSANGGEVSIAVLPFDDLSQARDQGYFADGVAEEILNSLARIPDPRLRVIARNSSFVFRGAKNLEEAGAALKVDHFLEGSVRKSGNQLRVTAQLINVKTDAHLWSQTYDRPLADIFAVQEDIARSVADALQVSLGVGIGQQPGMTRDVAAYDAYLAAAALASQLSLQLNGRAIELLQQAVAADPGFIKARLILADVYGRMPEMGAPDSQAWLQKADAAIREAGKLAPDSPLVLNALAQQSMVRGRWLDAGRQYRLWAAAARQCGCVGHADPIGEPLFVLLVGRAREALAGLEDLKAHNPLDTDSAFWSARAEAITGDFAAASAESERAYGLVASSAFVGRYLIAAGALTDALGSRDRTRIDHWMSATIASGGPAAPGQSDTAILKTLLDRPEAALAYLRPLVRNPAASGLDLSTVFPWLAYFGAPQDALEALRVAARRGATVEVTANFWSPLFGGVRQLPGFKQLVRDMGLVDYWREFGWGDFCKPTTRDDFQCH